MIFLDKSISNTREAVISLKNNPIQLKKYAEQNHLSATICQTWLTHNGHLLPHAKDQSSQTQLLKPWTPTANHKPFARLPAPPTTPMYQAIITRISTDWHFHPERNSKLVPHYQGQMFHKGTTTPMWKVAGSYISNKDDMEHARAHGIYIRHPTPQPTMRRQTKNNATVPQVPTMGPHCT